MHKISLINDISNLVNENFPAVEITIRHTPLEHAEAGEVTLQADVPMEQLAVLLSGFGKVLIVPGQPAVNLCLSDDVWYGVLDDMANLPLPAVNVPVQYPASADEPEFRVQHAQWRAGRAQGLISADQRTARRLAGALLVWWWRDGGKPDSQMKALLGLCTAWELLENASKQRQAAACRPDAQEVKKEAIQSMLSCALLAQATRVTLCAGLQKLNRQPIEEWNV